MRTRMYGGVGAGTGNRPGYPITRGLGRVYQSRVALLAYRKVTSHSNRVVSAVRNEQFDNSFGKLLG